MDLVDHQQGAVPPGLREVQVRGGGDRLIGGDIAGRPRRGSGALSAARTHSAWPKAARQAGSANASSACSRRVSRGTTQTTRSTRPAAISRVRGDHRQQRLAAAGRDRGQDVPRRRTPPRPPWRRRGPSACAGATAGTGRGGSTAGEAGRHPATVTDRDSFVNPSSPGTFAFSSDVSRSAVGVPLRGGPIPPGTGRPAADAGSAHPSRRNVTGPGSAIVG